MNNKKYTLVILCGKAGSGKDYLLSKILEHYGDELNPLVSDTTRPPRAGEEDGKEYNFLSYADFFAKKHIEVTSYNVTGEETWLYGTPYSALREDKINIGILNPDGVRQLYEKDDLNIHIFLVTATDKTRMLRQMNREKYPNYAEICRRFLADEEDFLNFCKYPFSRINNSENFEGEQAVAAIIDNIDQLKANFDRMR